MPCCLSYFTCCCCFVSAPVFPPTAAARARGRWICRSPLADSAAAVAAIAAATLKCQDNVITIALPTLPYNILLLLLLLPLLLVLLLLLLLLRPLPLFRRCSCCCCRH